MPNRKKKEKKKQTKKKRTKNFRQLCSLKTIKISISTSLNISTVSALNKSLQELCRTLLALYCCLRSVLLMLLKTKTPMVSIFILKYIIILWIHLGKICSEGNQTRTLRLTQCFPLKEGRVCTHLARKANGVDVWLRKNLKRIWVNHHNLIL